MISIVKILFTLAVIVVVYLGFKYRWRLTDMGRALSGRPVKPASTPKSGLPAAQDLVQCPKCRAYVAAGHPCSCERV